MRMTHAVEVKKDGKKFKVIVDGIKIGCSYSNEIMATSIANKHKEIFKIK